MKTEYKRSEAQKKYHREYYAKRRLDPEYRRKERERLSSSNHRMRQRGYFREYYKRQRAKVIEYYGGRCMCCGEKEDKFLAIDHMNGGGRKHYKEIGQRLYSWLIANKMPEGFQVLCHNCNMAKGLYGICPHKYI